MTEETMDQFLDGIGYALGKIADRLAEIAHEMRRRNDREYGRSL